MPDGYEAFEEVWRKLDLLGREVPPARNNFTIFGEERLVMTHLCTGITDLDGDVHHDSPCPVHDVRAEAAAARGRVLERMEAAKEAAPDPVLESKDWPWYEARLSVHVRESKPTDTFGEGGEELAHVRAWVQAPSFPDATERLDADLGVKWEQVKANAELVDTPPSPDVLPPPVKWWDRPLEVRTVVLVYALFITLLTILAVAVST